MSLPSVASARTSGDYHYIVGNGFLWTWFLHTNALARALGLPASKDVFLSSREGEGHDGDPHAEAEALLAALSAGPVGIGDRRGRTDRDLVLRCCRPDGVLVKPDAPIAALDRCYGAHAFTTPSPLLGETYTDHPAGRWVYLASLHAYKGDEALDFRVALEDLGESAPTDDVLVYDWRRGETQRLAPSGEIAVTLEHREWDYRVVCPILDGEVAVIGDPSLYATAGDRRVRDVRSKAGGVSFEVLGVPGEHVRILGWSARPAQCEGAAVSRDARTGHWSLRVRVGDRGWEPVRLRS